ncbi:MAG TPA: VOC family protein [Ktedonobacteraceae bacterium]|nr:VOC family protein [Ktedonobacteraceae bacterium]
MNILRQDHTALLVWDLERSRHFYREVLQMEEVPGLGTIWLRSGSAEIHLLSLAEAHGDQTGAGRYHPLDLAEGHITHIAFQVEDLEQVQSHLGKHQIPIVCGPRPRGNDGEQLYICDPDGYVIELFTKTNQEKSQ